MTYHTSEDLNLSTRSLENDGIFLITKSDGSESRHIKASNLLSGAVDDWFVLANQDGNSKKIKVGNLKDVSSPESLWMLVNNGPTSYKIKVIDVLDTLAPRPGVIWSEYSECLNVDNPTYIRPKPTDGTVSASCCYTRTFAGNPGWKWYLFRPYNTANGVRLDNVRWVYSIPVSVGLYCQTLRLKIGWQTENGKGDIFVNGLKRLSGHRGSDYAPSWTATMTINDTINTIVGVQTNNGFQSFGIEAVEINGVILVDGQPIPRRISNARVAELVARPAEIYTGTTDIQEGDNNAEVQTESNDDES